MKKLRKFIRSRWYKLLQQVVIMVLAFVLAGCAAANVGYAQPVLPALGAAADKVSVITVSGFEMIENMDADEAYLLSKPGNSAYIFSYLKADMGRAFVFISNGNVLPRGLLIGINRTADAMTTFVRDGYNLIPATVLPTLFSKLPLPTIMLMPTGTDFDWRSVMYPTVQN